MPRWRDGAIADACCRLDSAGRQHGDPHGRNVLNESVPERAGRRVRVPLGNNLAKVRVYHRTDHAGAIVEHGFRDATGTYMTDHEFSGVWVADRPLDPNEGAWGRFVISLDVPESELEPYEWVEEGRFYREFLVPAELLNGRPFDVVQD